MDLMNVYDSKERCCGCSACAAACPKQCISMQADHEGFLYPEIDNTLCIQCGKCQKVCPVINKTATTIKPDCYVAYSKDDQIRKHSSSGGMFTELANMTLAEHGVVFGAAMGKNMKVLHQAAASPEELKALQGSKYVQSEMGTVYRQVKEAIDAGRPVYFSGTPCQVAGLYTFLGNRPENLITQDIICHGVPSPKVWEHYLKLRSKGEIVKRVSFRDKTYGWHYFSMAIETGNRMYIKRLDEDVYTRLFLDNVILRPSCYNCQHKHMHTNADITIGDCWSLGKMNTKVADDDRGLSLVIINTEKGKQLFNSIHVNSVEIPFDAAVSSQTAITQSVPYNQNRELFFALAEERGMEAVLQKWYGFDRMNLLKAKYGYYRYNLAQKIKKKGSGGK